MNKARSHIFERLLLGTWQLSGNFRPLTTADAARLISSALAAGITRFDTAPVYGDGLVEAILGSTVPAHCQIVTKVPARPKPPVTAAKAVNAYYSRESVFSSIEGSLKRLRKDTLDLALLHNWASTWGGDSAAPLLWLRECQERGQVKRIGISLPDSFSPFLDSAILDHVDCIEAPFNRCNTWIIPHLPALSERGIEVIFRSIFLHGLLLKDPTARANLAADDPRRVKALLLGDAPRFSVRELLAEAWSFGASVVVGATAYNQLEANIRLLEGETE